MSTPHLAMSDALRLARGLGWFSVALGALELLAPRKVGRALGMEHETGMIQAFGARELAAGVGLLAAGNPKPWIWGRVAGDALDLATLAANADRRNPQREMVGVALAAVAAVTIADLICLASLDRGPDGRPLRPVARDYGDRSGYPDRPEAMRGAAARDGEAKAPVSDRPAF